MRTLADRFKIPSILADSRRQFFQIDYGKQILPPSSEIIYLHADNEGEISARLEDISNQSDNVRTFENHNWTCFCRYTKSFWTARLCVDTITINVHQYSLHGEYFCEWQEQIWQLSSCSISTQPRHTWSFTLLYLSHGPSVPNLDDLNNLSHRPRLIALRSVPDRVPGLGTRPPFNFPIPFPGLSFGIGRGPLCS